MRHLSPAAFALAVVLFFMPWVAISCDVDGKRQELCELRGIDLAVGLKGCMDEKGPAGGELPQGLTMQGKGSSTDTKALLALIAAVAGLATSFLIKNAGQRSLAGTVCGFAGAVLVLLLQTGGGGQEVPGLTFQYKVGYWLTLAALIAAGVASRKAKAAASPPAPPTSAGGGS